MQFRSSQEVPIVTPTPIPLPPTLVDPMQVSVSVVVNAGAYTVGADLMSALVWTGVAGELNVMFWALEELPLEALASELPPVALPPVALEIEPLAELEVDEELEVSGPTVTPPLLALEPPLTRDWLALELEEEPALLVEVCGPTVVVWGPTLTPPLLLLLPWLWIWPCACWALEAASELEVCWAMTVPHRANAMAVERRSFCISVPT